MPLTGGELLCAPAGRLPATPAIRDSTSPLTILFINRSPWRPLAAMLCGCPSQPLLGRVGDEFALVVRLDPTLRGHRLDDLFRGRVRCLRGVSVDVLLMVSHGGLGYGRRGVQSGGDAHG